VCYDKIIDASPEGKPVESYCLKKTEYGDFYWWTISSYDLRNTSAHPLSPNIYKFEAKKDSAKDPDFAAVPQVGWRLNLTSERSVEPVPLILYPDGHTMKDWRLDSNSECKITVFAEHEQKTLTTEYCVHRDILNGLNGCNILSRSKKDKYTSKVKLHHSAANQFPVMLDFIYRGELRMSQHNAIILKYLANLFECKPMLQQVNRFCHKEMSNFSSAIWSLFYNQARELEYYAVTAVIEKACGDSFDELIQEGRDNKQLAATIPLSAWKRIFADVELDEVNSIGASMLLEEVFEQHKAGLTADLFEALTAKLTSVDYDATQGLLKRDFYFKSASKANPRDVEELSRIQALCVSAIASRLIELAENSEGNAFAGLALIQAELERLPTRCPMIVTQTLMEVVMESATEYDSENSDSDNGNMRIIIKTMTGETLLFNVELSCTIDRLKQKIQRKTGFRIDQQRLTNEDSVLEDGRTLADYNVQSDDYFDLTLLQVGC
jgi:hypothetical protein